jgi:hypothetical protein
VLHLQPEPQPSNLLSPDQQARAHLADDLQHVVLHLCGGQVAVSDEQLLTPPLALLRGSSGIHHYYRFQCEVKHISNCRHDATLNPAH